MLVNCWDNDFTSSCSTQKDYPQTVHGTWHLLLYMPVSALKCEDFCRFPFFDCPVFLENELYVVLKDGNK